MLVPAFPTRPHPPTSFTTSNHVSFSFHSRWVISLSVDAGNQGNPAWLIVADIRWQNLYTPVGTQRQGEEREGFRLQSCHCQPTGDFEMRDYVFTDKEFLCHRKTIRCKFFFCKYSVHFIYKNRNSILTTRDKKSTSCWSHSTLLKPRPDLKFSNEITKMCLLLHKQTRKIPWLCLYWDNAVYRILLGATNWALCQVLWSLLL